MRKLPLRLMADNVRSAQNIGSMLRTADAFLVAEMIMAGISSVPPSPEISKTALGAEDSVSWRHVDDAVAEVKRLKDMGVLVYVLEQTHGSVPLQDLYLPSPADSPEGMLLVVGNEVKGVDQRIVDMADVAVEIPMHGTKHSLNVSVSTGIALWIFYRQLYKYTVI
ncbi:MAG: TrmH family RNA methyltransferase [Muribaculaceae bacterium]|nr:TrmH family RNA methyltransferase [Muribaculaceae bacterium]